MLVQPGLIYLRVEFRPLQAARTVRQAIFLSIRAHLAVLPALQEPISRQMDRRVACSALRVTFSLNQDQVTVCLAQLAIFVG